MAKPPAHHSLLWVAPELFPEPGGIGNQAAYLAKHLGFLGYDVTVLADTTLITEAEATRHDEQQSYRVHRIYRRRPILSTYLSRIRSFWSLARRHQNVICSGKWPIWLGGFFAPYLSKPQLTAIVHGSELDLPSALGRWWMKRSLRRFHKIIAVSSYTAQHLPDFPKGLPEVKVIGNGIDPIDFEGVGINGFARPVHGQPALITVGSVKERKGQHKVIEAMPDILKQYPNAKYHVVGLPNEEGPLRKRAQELGLNGAVQFHGVQSRQATQHLLKASDVFLLPSQHTARGDFEGYGIAILEANALGLPAIASLHSGSRDAVTEESGLLLEDATPQALSEAVSTILGNAPKYTQGAKTFSATRTWARVAHAYHCFLSE